MAGISAFDMRFHMLKIPEISLKKWFLHHARNLVIPKENLSSFLLNNVEYQEKEKFVSFGWGDKNFYANTPTWKDVTFSVGFKALFLKW